MSAEEKAWLARHGKIRVGYQGNYMAFCAKNAATGELTDALKDYLDYAAGAFENARLEFEAVCYASSRADFINIFQIALKECYETDYWLAIFHDAGLMSEEEYANTSARCSKIRRLLIASITTAKNNREDRA